MPSEESAPSGVEQLQVLIQESQKEHDQIQKELKEIDVLIRQSTAEVEKLAQRNTQIANRVRQMEMNIDTYPREDIRDLYAAAHEAQMRLFMMRGQLEQLQNRQQNLEMQSQRLARVVEMASQIAPADVARAPDGPATSQSDIVRVIEAQENERQRLARQMHDGPAQSLTNLMLQAEICERLFDTDPIQARVELGNLKNSTNTTFQKIRDFILTLRPMMLDDLGLMPTLKQYVADYEEKSGLAANFTVMGRETRLPSHVEVALFRTIQELLTNIQTHAHATHAQVLLDFQDGLVSASVEDDGSGFDVGEVQNPSQQRKGLGLATIQERAEMLGGRVQIESRIGRGTKIRIELPSA
ncbi:MAG: histidine kinase [Anaerolineae bacterium]|jgi:two-component system, NarL family, sensor histidine kinase DegS